jgi:peptidase E
VLAQDVIWVAGGSVADLLALWRLHGVGPAMHAAWEAGRAWC